MSQVINETLSADGSTAVYQAKTNDTVIAVCTGTFGSGTITAEVSGDNTNWVAAGADSTITEAGSFKVEIKKDMYYRLTLSGSTSPSIKCIAFE